MRILRLGLLIVVPVLLLVAVEPQAAPAAVPSSSTAPGDIDCDGNVTMFDAIGLLGSVAGIAAPANCVASNGDLTCDEQQNQQDVIEILTLLAEVPRAPCGGAATSFDLIQMALENDELSEEIAALYSVFAAFDDPRLPGQFAATMSASLEMPVDLNLIGSQANTFSPSVQAQLAPFFIAPMHEGSWWDLQNSSSTGPAGFATAPGPIMGGDWGFVDAETANVKLWYPLHDFALLQLANTTAQEIDSHIWPQLTGLMGRQPLPDLGGITQGRGGDDRIDIIVSNGLPTFGALGLAPNWCERTSALIFADPEISAHLQVPFHIAVAHELMHAIIFSYDLNEQPGGQGGCGDAGYNWWHEATATWTEHFLYPATNTEHTGPRGNGNVEDFISTLAQPLEKGADPFRGTHAGRVYGAYLWAFYVAHEYGNQIIPQMWENMQGADAFTAMENALPNGFEEAWPEFVLSVLNKAPFDNFRLWDGVEQEPDHNGSTYRAHEVPVGLNTYVEFHDIERDGDFPIDWLGTEHLAATVFSYKFVDEDIRSVTFYNGFFYNVAKMDSESGTFFAPEVRPEADTRGLHVEALIKIAGEEWIREDWTMFHAQTFCRDVASERIEEIVLIATNSVPEKDYKITYPSDLGGPKMFVSDIGCWKWEGSIESVEQGDGWQMTTTIDNLVVERDPLQVSPFAVPYNINFIATGGTMDWSYTGSIGECTVNGNETGLALEQNHSFQTIIDIFEGPYVRSVQGSFYPVPDLLPYTQTCPDDPPEQDEWFVGLSFPSTQEAFKLEDGAIASGTTHIDPGIDITWHFEAQRE